RRRTHTTTPFPYTTLFRSHQRRHRVIGAQDSVVQLEGRVRAGGQARVQPGTELRQRGWYPWYRATASATCTGSGGSTARSGAGGDRKSTRLNSSHVAISYA